VSPLSSLIRRWERRSPLSAEDRAAIEALPVTRRMGERDAYLVQEGQPTTTCALLLSGMAFRQKLIRDGARQIVSIHIPGQFVDLQNCLLDVADHNVQALTRVELAVISKGALNDLAAARPALAKALWLDTLADAAIFREWIVNVGRRDAKSRIAHLLCELVLRLDAAGQGNHGAYKFPLTQEQLADATGLTAVHTNRTLQALRKDRLISLSSQALTVLDWRGLCHLGDFSERYLRHAL